MSKAEPGGSSFTHQHENTKLQVVNNPLGINEPVLLHCVQQIKIFLHGFIPQFKPDSPYCLNEASNWCRQRETSRLILGNWVQEAK